MKIVSYSKKNQKLFILCFISILAFSTDQSINTLLFTKFNNSFVEKTKLKKAELLPPPNPASLLIDVAVNNTSPSTGDVLKYKFRYRYASTTEHGTNAQIQFTLPPAYQIVSEALIGGSIANISNSGNQYTISLASPSSLGLPTGTLAAGSSGIFEFQVKFDCGTNGVGDIPAAGTTVNLTQNPVFTVTGVSNTASAPAAVTVPTVSVCTTPTNSANGSFHKYSNRDVVGQGMYHWWNLQVPESSTTYTTTDIFPVGFKLYEGANCCTNFDPGWTIEVQANGSWWNITNFLSVDAFIQNVANGAALKDQSGTTIPGTMRVDAVVPNGDHPGDKETNYAEGVTGLRITGSGSHEDFYLYFYVPPSTPVGWYQNCMTSTNPAWGTDCKDVYVTDKGSLELGCWFQDSGGQGLGGTTLNRTNNSYVYNNFPNLHKDPMDIQGVLVAAHLIKTTSVEAPTYETLLPEGFDYIEGTTKPNYWVVEALELGSNPASALQPTFTKTSNYNGTGRTLLQWDFPNLIFPAFGPHYINEPIVELKVYFSTRYMGTVALANPVIANTTLRTKSVMTWTYGGAGFTGTPTQEIGCAVYYGAPADGGSVNSEKYVKGALDTKQSRYPVSGNTELSGDATYDMYVYNHNFQRLKQIDIADILPYIGDKDMLATTSRGSGWSEELANAITVERYKIGSGLVDASSKIPSGILYSNTYNACYLDGALPAGQVTANMASANTGQSAGCTDFSNAVAAAGAKGFAFRWIDIAEPLEFGEYLKITVNVTQLNGEADATNNEVAWNSFGYTVIEEDNDVLFSSEPLKVGVKMIDMSSVSNICGNVWKDENANGRQENGEPIVEGITVSLYDGSGNPVTQTLTINGVTSTVNVTALTDTLGNYCFYGLTPSTNYYVRLENENNFTLSGALAGLELTIPNASGVLDEEDSDASEGTLSGSPAIARPQILVPTGVAGTTIENNDFGFYGFGSVGNYAWYDDDAEGDQDNTESPASGVTMSLYKVGGFFVESQITDVDGRYLFTNQIPGEYYIVATTIPAGKIPTGKNTTGNNENDSDFSANSSFQTDNFSLSSGENIGDIDLGLKDEVINPASICGKTWDDLDEDGVIDGGEPSQPWVSINLLDTDGFVVSTTISDEDGDYCFNNLEPNITYELVFLLPSVNGSSYTNAGSNMEASSTTGISLITYTPTANQNITNVDCGFIGPFSIGNLVWLDANGNALKEASESAISNVTVSLLNSSGSTTLATTTTDAYGKYVFTGLTEGSYKVQVTLPNNMSSTADIGSSSSPNSADDDDNGLGTATSGNIVSDVIVLEQGGGSNAGANWFENDHGEIINRAYDPASNPKAYYTMDFGLKSFTPEDCTDGIDNDGDGLIDCNDPDCKKLTNQFPGFPIDFSNNNCSWIDYFLGDDLSLVDNGNGTMTIAGSIVDGIDADFDACVSTPCGANDGWTLNLTLFDKQDWTTFQASGGSANLNGSCAGAEANLDYWNITGTLTGTGCNIGRTLTITGPEAPYRLQIGNGANNGDATCAFGMSTWFSINEGGTPMKADIYAFVNSACYNATNCQTGLDSDNDGVSDICDEDDDNDGILDVDECPIATNSGLTGPLTTFTTDITTTDATSSSVPHILNSITYNGITYSDFITPDVYTPGYTVIDINEVNFVENGVDYVYSLGSNANYNQDIITDAFGNKNLNAHQSLDSEDFSDGDYYILTYNDPIISTSGGFIAITERMGNNEYYIDALDHSNNLLGSIIVNTSDYVDLGVNVFATGTQNANMALYPVDDLAPIGAEISSLKISFGTSITATNDGPDGKVFIIGDMTTIACDYDGDGIPNDLDLDSDNDGCPDALEGGANFTHTNLSSDRLTGGVDASGIPTQAAAGQTMGSSQNENVNVCCDANISGYTDTDNDGIIDVCDEDDDNDGILDVVECPTPANSGLTGPLTTFTGHVTTTDANSNAVPHILDSITYNGTTYTDFIVPDSYTPGFTLNDNTGVRYVKEGAFLFSIGSNPNYNIDILPAFQSRNLNAYQDLDLNDFSDGDYFDLKYNTPVISTTGGFIAVTERGGNNPQVIQALDASGNIIGTTVNVSTSDYVDLGVRVDPSGGQTAKLALYPIDDLAPVGTYIHGIRLSFGTTSGAQSDGPDAKAFLFGDVAQLSCDYDGDGIPNHQDLDSDNDGCPDALEGGASFTYTNMDNTTALTGAVNANGIPTQAGAGQTIGTSQDENVQNPICDQCNPANPAYKDSDGDSYGDYCDLDDDNDGILDTDECASFSARINNYHNVTPAITSPASPLSDASANYYPLGSTRTYDYTDVNGNVHNYTENISSSNFAYAGIYTNPAYAEYGFIAFLATAVQGTTASPRPVGSFESMEFIFNSGLVDNLSFYLQDVDFTEEARVIGYNGVTPVTPSIGGVVSSYQTLSYTPLGEAKLLADGVTDGTDFNTVIFNQPVDRIVVSYHNPYGVGRNSGSFQMFGFFDNSCQDDYDNDGIPNNLDPDSDNDDCPDAIEGGASFTASNIDVNDRLTGGVDANGVPTVATASGQTVGSSQNSGINNCGETCNNNIDDDGDGFIDCADPDCGIVNITNTTISNCIDQPYADVAKLDVTVSWTTTPTDTIEVSIAGKTEHINVGSSTSPVTVSFMVPADGSANNAITANFKYKICETTTTYTAPAACSNDQLTCSVLYICGDSKGADADAFDHGLVDYIDGINGNAVLTPALAKDEAGMGLYDPMNPSNPLAITLTDYDIIFISSTTWGDLSSDLLDDLKDTEASVLTLIHDYLDDLEMALYKSYISRNYAYSDNTTQVQLYNFNNTKPRYNPLVGSGDYFPATADAYLWRSTNNQSSNLKGVFFHYTASDNLTGVAATHGSRTFLGYMMDGVYWNEDTNQGATPVPQAEWFDPIRHLTQEGKFYLDQALILASQDCTIEDCTDNIDNDGDGLIDCADPDCEPSISNVGVTQPTCANKTGGQIIITATGTGTLSYSINNQPTWQASNTFSGLGMGQYTIRVKNNSGCETEYTSNPIILDFSTCVEICNDGIDNDGDGLIDCDDPDCDDVGTVNDINNN